MTTALVLIGLAAYFVGGPIYLSWKFRRIDDDFRRDMHQVLRSMRGRSEQAARPSPQGLSAAAGVERGAHPNVAAAPPAPPALVGAARPRDAAPTRPPRVRIGGGL